MRFLLILSTPLISYSDFTFRQHTRQLTDFLCYVMQTIYWAMSQTVPSTNKTNRPSVEGCGTCMRYEIKERFWFQSGAFNQINWIWYSSCIHIHVISYVVIAVKINFHRLLLLLKKKERQCLCITFCPLSWCSAAHDPNTADSLHLVDEGCTAL